MFAVSASHTQSIDKELVYSFGFFETKCNIQMKCVPWLKRRHYYVEAYFALELLSCEVNTFQHRWIGIPLFFMTIKSYQTVESHQHRRHVDLQTESFGAQVCVCVLLLRYQLQPALDTHKNTSSVKRKKGKKAAAKSFAESTPRISFFFLSKWHPSLYSILWLARSFYFFVWVENEIDNL